MVGTETIGSPEPAEIALVRSIALPPPRASSPSPTLGGLHCVVDSVGRHLGPDTGDLDGKPIGRPAVARHEERPLDAELGEQAGQLGETPANLHQTRVLAKSTNASDRRVPTRPLARTSEIWRVGSSPRTRAVASLPAASSASTAAREMNVTP